ncbi:MAG: hypothetical protein Q9P01_03260 [Anaerolineae bacterium]|nr:hypothetical protein [Anaerolineae bacterium]
MTDSISSSESNNEIPLVGRATIYARLQQHVLDPPNRQAIVFTGHDGIGKSSLLRLFSHVFDNQILGIYISLADAPLNTEDDWLHYLLDCSNAVLDQHNFTLSRLPQKSGEDVDFSDWFRDVYLYEVLHMIRPQRRIVWLLDDAEYLLDALPQQVDYLHHLLQTHLQLALIFTIDTEHEQRLDELAPLVHPASAERLHRFDVADSIDLIRQYTPGVADEIANRVYEATGGHPRLLSHFGQALHATWASHSDKQALETARPIAYAASDSHFRQMWKLLSRDERLVLTAIASLIYDDPLQSVIVERIEAWLVETDYPMDNVAIHAALLDFGTLK